MNENRKMALCYIR